MNATGHPGCLVAPCDMNPIQAPNFLLASSGLCLLLQKPLVLIEVSVVIDHSRVFMPHQV